MVRLIVDSTCDMPEEWRARYQIRSVSLMVNIDDKMYRDGKDITISDLYEVMRKGVFPKTSQAPADELDTAFREAAEGGDDCLYLSFSSEMSGTYNLANIIARQILEEYPQRRIEIVDSRGGSFATGLIAMQLSKLIEQGMTLDMLAQRARTMTGIVEHLFTLSSLEWLSKGGRIARPIGMAGDILKLKPILDVKNGKMEVIQIVRGRKKALSALVEKVAERASGFPRQLIGLTHADDLASAQTVKQMILERLPEAQIEICEIGCVLGVHLGIGGVGVFFFREMPQDYGII